MTAGRRPNRPRYLLGCGECSIAAVSGPASVAGYGPEVIGGVRTQARDVGSDILVVIASPDLIRRSGSVADGSSILKVDRGG